MGRRHKNRHKGHRGGLNFEFDQANEAALEGDSMINLPKSVKTGQKEYTYYGNGQGYGYGSGGTVWKSCSHPGDKVVYESHGKKLYASNTHSLDEFSGKWELIIDLANVVTKPTGFGFVKGGNPERFNDLRQFTFRPNTVKSELLQLDWPDMGAPPATLDFWKRLWELLPEKTVVCCFGGHGRTGTCLASLLIADGIDYYSAIETIRNDHCDKAIESLTQTRYLHALYLDYLKSAIQDAVTANDPATVKELIEDLKYAEGHVPSTKSDFGDAIVIDMKGDASKDTIVDVKGDFVEERIKQVGGVLYVKECNNNYCPLHAADCDDPDHLSWVRWDESATNY